MDSYDTICSRMKRKYREQTGYMPDDASDIGIRIQLLAGEIFSFNTYLEWVKNQIFPQTATGNSLDYHGEIRGIIRKTAAKAKGLLTFLLDEALDTAVTIPKGTICSTSGNNPIRFVTLSAVTINAGSKQNSVLAEAVISGSCGNAAPQNINKMVTLPVNSLKVINYSEFTGGLDEESDDEYRKRILDSYKEISNGTNFAYYKSTAKSVNGVHSVGVVPRKRGVGTVDLFIADKGRNCSSSVLNAVQSLLYQKREVNVDVKINHAALVSYPVMVTIYMKPGYDFDTAEGAIRSALTEYFKNLGVGENVYLASLGDIIKHIEGIENYEFSGIYMSDMIPEQSQLVTLGAVNILDGDD